MAKLPGIVQQPIGEFRKGNIPVPNVMATAEALGAFASVFNDKIVARIDEATGLAATEISELKAILVNQNTVDSEWVGNDALGEIQISTVENGEREITTAVKMFTHEVADELWATRTKEIIEHYGGTIADPKARAKFIGEMHERYVAPGTEQVASANIIRSRAYGQAQAERAIETTLASDAPTEVRESQSREIIARQMLLGADPVWGERQIANLGPTIDQMNVQNSIIGAQSVDAIDQIVEEMWRGETRMTPEQLRTMTSEADKKRTDIRQAKSNSQTENADAMFGQFVAGQLSNQGISDAVTGDAITKEAGWVLYNALNSGDSAKATDPFTVSRYQGEIFRLQYTGNNMGVIEKAKWLKRDIAMASMGLDRNGAPTGTPATITGADALKLNKDIDAAVNAAVENDEYDNALKEVMAWTRSKLDLSGQITTELGGNQNQVEAAIAFKRALDDYMNQYGVEAKPSDFVQKNRDAYDPRNFNNGIDGRFFESVTHAQPFITRDGSEYVFTTDKQEEFAVWLYDNRASLGTAEYNRISALYTQYYLGRGMAPGGELMFDPNDPAYWQFQRSIQPRAQDE